MKPAVFTLVIALLTAGASFPSLAQNNQQQNRSKSRNYSLKSTSYMMGRYSKMMNDMISGALRMDLTEEQKTKVSGLRDAYLYPMTKDENALRSADMNVMKMLEDPSFDPAKVKEEIGKANGVEKKISDSYVDGLVSIREAVGKEKYDELSKSVNRFRNNMVQMRKNKNTRMYKHGVSKDETAKKTAPASPSPDNKN